MNDPLRKDILDLLQILKNDSAYVIGLKLGQKQSVVLQELRKMEADGLVARTRSPVGGWYIVHDKPTRKD